MSRGDSHIIAAIPVLCERKVVSCSDMGQRGDNLWSQRQDPRLTFDEIAWRCNESDFTVVDYFAMPAKLQPNNRYNVKDSK